MHDRYFSAKKRHLAAGTALALRLGEETADISFADAATLGIQQGEIIRVRSRRGNVAVKANITPEIPPGMVWMAFHFTEGNANWLTNAAFDPNTLTAEYKACAVRLEKISPAP